MKTWFGIMRRIAAGMAFLALAACASDAPPPADAPPQQDKGMVDGLIDMVTPGAAPPCPNVKVMRGTGWITSFSDAVGRDITDIVYEGELLGFDGTCADNGKGGLAVALMARMAVTLGPAAPSRAVKLPYVVALVKGQEVLVRQRFDVGVDFPSNLNRVIFRDEEVVINVPLAAGESGPDYDVYVGFVLERDQVEYNKSHSR